MRLPASVSQVKLEIMRYTEKQRFDLVKNTIKEIIRNEDESIESIVSRMGLKKYIPIYKQIDFTKVDWSDVNELTRQVLKGLIESKFRLDSIKSESNSEIDPIQELISILYGLKFAKGKARESILNRYIGNPIYDALKNLDLSTLNESTERSIATDLLSKGDMNKSKNRKVALEFNLDESGAIYKACEQFINLLINGSAYKAAYDATKLKVRIAEKIRELGFVNIGNTIYPRYVLTIIDQDIPTLIKVALMECYSPNHPDLKSLKESLRKKDLSDGLIYNRVHENKEFYDRVLSLIDYLEKGYSIYQAQNLSGLKSSEFVKTLVKYLFTNIGTQNRPIYSLSVPKSDIDKLIEKAYKDVTEKRRRNRLDKKESIQESNEPMIPVKSSTEIDLTSIKNHLVIPISDFPQFIRYSEELKDLVEPLKLNISYSNGQMDIFIHEDSPIIKLLNWLKDK